jgi:hypothetical protein
MCICFSLACWVIIMAAEFSVLSPCPFNFLTSVRNVDLIHVSSLDNLLLIDPHYVYMNIVHNFGNTRGKSHKLHESVSKTYIIRF